MLTHFNAAMGVYSRLPRYQEIVRTLFRFGFSDLLKAIKPQGGSTGASVEDGSGAPVEMPLRSAAAVDSER